MEPFGGGKGERSHFLLHISQCLSPPSLRRPPGLGPASLQLLRLLLAHKLVMAFPGERSTTQGARLGLGGSASQCLPPTSPPPPPSTPPPPRLPSAPPPPHQLHGSAGLGAPCPGTRPQPPLTWGTSLSISPDTPLYPVWGGRDSTPSASAGSPAPARSLPTPSAPLARCSRASAPPPARHPYLADPLLLDALHREDVLANSWQLHGRAQARRDASGRCGCRHSWLPQAPRCGPVQGPRHTLCPRRLYSPFSSLAVAAARTSRLSARSRTDN